MISLPSKPIKVSGEGNKAVFEVENLYPGYGQTIGNSLRRVLLSSLKGTAITSIKIEGVQHEFSTIEGVMEDVVEILLNLKEVRFKIQGDSSYQIKISAKGEKEVKAKDFDVPSQVEVINGDVHIATLTSKKSTLEITAIVESGLGYVPTEARSKEKVEVGVIALDAAFSPVRHVNYNVENMRVGDRTDYNRLRVDIETDGSITPEDAFGKAVLILGEQFEALRYGKQKEVKELHRQSLEVADEPAEKTEEEDYGKIKVEELKFSSRTLNALMEAGIKTLGGLSKKGESKLREVEGIGDKGIQEIKKALGNYGIVLKT